MTSTTVYAEPDDLRAFIERLFLALRLDAEAARQVAESVIFAEARGFASQGVGSIPALASRLTHGGIALRPAVAVRQVSASAAVVDGGNGIGAVVGNAAMHKAVALAAESGVGIVTARRSNDFGAGSHYAMQALDRTFIGICAANASVCAALAENAGALTRSQGFAVAIPAGRRSPIVVDIAPVCDAAAQGASASPFSTVSAILIEAFTGVLSGSGVGRQVRGAYADAAAATDTGQIFMAVDPGMFMPLRAFLDRVDALVAVVKDAQRPAAILPGEMELGREKETRKSGIPLPHAVVQTLGRLGRELGVAVPAMSDSPLRRGR